MPIAIRIVLVAISGTLAWVLYRRDGPVILWIYFLFAAYSTASFQPFQTEWWNHIWLWAEPIRMCIRTAATMTVFRDVQFFRPSIRRISTLVAAAFALLYRVTVGPTDLDRFMAVRTYWLMILAVFLITALLCLWRLGEPSPYRLKFWCSAVSCYAASAVIDWTVTTTSGWIANTELWSIALTCTLSMWVVKEYLEYHKQREREH